MEPKIILALLAVSWENMFDAATCYHYVIAFVCCDVGEQKPINTEVKRRVIIRLCTTSLTDIVLSLVLI